MNGGLYTGGDGPFEIWFGDIHVVGLGLGGYGPNSGFHCRRKWSLNITYFAAGQYQKR